MCSLQNGNAGRIQLLPASVLRVDRHAGLGEKLEALLQVTSRSMMISVVYAELLEDFLPPKMRTREFKREIGYLPLMIIHVIAPNFHSIKIQSYLLMGNQTVTSGCLVPAFLESHEIWKDELSPLQKLDSHMKYLNPITWK